MDFKVWHAQVAQQNAVVSVGIRTHPPVDFSVTSTGATATSEETSGLKEFQQVDIELVFVRVRKAVGCARIDFQGRVLD